MEIVDLSFDEKIIINKSGVPVVISVRKPTQYFSHVSFGIDAPRHISVDREEIYCKKVASNNDLSRPIGKDLDSSIR